jgi:hypothetical protein
MNQRIFAALLLILVATSAAALELTVTPTSLFLPSGETETISVTVTNNDAVSIDLVSFDHEDTPITVDLSALPTLPITLPAGDDATFTIDVTSGSAGNYVVTFEAEANTSATAMRTLQISVPQEPGFSVSAFEAGSASQRRDRETTGSLTIDNAQNLDLTGLTYTTTVPARYGLNLSGVPSTIDRFDTATITYELFVPATQDSGRIRIGEVIFTANEITYTLPVHLTVQSGLVIDDIEFETENDRSRRLEDGDRIDIDFQPGDEVTVRVTVRNELDIYIESVRVEMTIEDIDDRRDISERSSRIDIRDDDEEIFEFSFEIPRDVDEDSYDVVFVVEGTDEDGVFHEARATLELEVERERDALRFERFDVAPTSVCPGDTIVIETLTSNVGTRRQDNARVLIELREWNLADEESFSIDAAGRRNDEYRSTLSIRIPDDAEPGTYELRGSVFYRASLLTDFTSVRISVRDCDPAPSQPTQPPVDSGVIIIEPITPPPQPPATDGAEPAGRDGVYFWLLVALNVLVIFIVIAFIIRLLMK